jgi:myo-inositol-1-phosphate synthase
MTANRRIGLWLVGAKGGVASTTILGLLALRKGLIGTTGLVTETPPFRDLDLARWDELVVGGHEIRNLRLAEEAMRVATEMRAVPLAVVEQCRGELDEIDCRVRPGTVHNVGPAISGLADAAVPREPSPGEILARLRHDIEEFRAAVAAEHVVVLNVASTEPPADAAGLPDTWAQMERALREKGDSPHLPERPEGCFAQMGTVPFFPSGGTRSVPDTLLSVPDTLPASSLYAIAALDLGCTYINFTPSLGAGLPAIDELARLRGACHCGADGKTGETLLKSVLAPMFARRNLQVLSWVSHNIFGNMDGRVLDDPLHKRSKIASKEHLVGEILGYRPQSHISIEYIPDLGDWKTAWDHVHFAGFLGTPMTLQFIWQGCDSVLAAPLVLDLVRLAERATRRGQSGALRFLASFFKSPLGVTEHRFDRQFQMLEDWAEEVRAESVVGKESPRTASGGSGLG